MKIALVGHGRMGRAIEQIALERGHEIVAVVDVDNAADLAGIAATGADVAIEFSTPATAEANCRRVLAQGVPVVSGTTGWESGRLALAEGPLEAPFMWASNYSLGVNLFFAINRHVARLMDNFPQYVPSVHEIHHVHKADHPSGTARTLAEDIVALDGAVGGWAEPDGPVPPATVMVSHQRLGETPGTHTVNWTSPHDEISLTHRAFSRSSFALGAVLAAEWLKGRPAAFHTFTEVVDDIIKSAP